MDLHLFKELFRSESHLKISKLSIKALGYEMALFLTDLTDRDQYFQIKNQDYDGWFYSTKEYRSEDLGVSERTLQRWMKTALEEGYIEVEQKGIPAKQWIRLNYQLIHDKLAEYGVTSSLAQSRYTSGTPSRNTYIRSLNKEDNPPLNIPPQRPQRPTRPIKKLPTTFIEMFPKSFQQEESFIAAWDRFFKWRKSKVALTTDAVTIIVNKFKNLPVEAIVQALNDTVEKGYRGVFVPKQFEGTAPLRNATTPEIKSKRPLRNHGLCYDPDSIPNPPELEKDPWHNY